MLRKIRPVWIALSLLTLAVLSLFGPALRHPTYILFPTFSTVSDILVIHWPKAHLIAQNWRAGQGLPYWTPQIMSGMPLAANQLAMLFYPPAWLFLMFPLEVVFNLLFIIHLILGGSGIYFLLREGHNVSMSAAVFGSLTFALNGKWLAHAAGGHVSMVGAIGWMPWAAFGTVMLLKVAAERPARTQIMISSPLSPRLLWAALVAAALTMQILTHTLILIYSTYLVIAVAAWQLIVMGPGKKTWGHKKYALSRPFALRSLTHLLVLLLTIPLLAGLLGAVQLLPLLELAQFSNRALSLSQAAEYAVSPLQLFIGLFLPSPQAGHELIIYLGLVPLLLAPFGLTRGNRWSWFYASLFIFTILFALGPNTPVHSLFYYFAPGFRWVRTPARIYFLGTLAVAVLAGFGIDRLPQLHGSAKLVRWLTRLTIAVGSLALLVSLGLATGFGQVNRAVLALGLLVPAGLILSLLCVRRIIPAKVAVALLGMLLYLDLVSFDLSLMRFVPPAEALAPGRPAAEYLAQKPGLFRIYSPSYSLPMQTAAAAGLALADGVEPVHLAVYDRFMARAGGYDDDSFSVPIPNFGGKPLESALKETEPDLKLLGLLNVNYLVSAFPMPWPGLTLEKEIEGTFIYRNEQAMPRAWVVRQPVSADADWLAQLTALPLAGTVILDSGPGHTAGDQGGSSLSHGTKIIHYSPNLIEIEVDQLTEPGGWLVLSEIWYPGWQAHVNGSPQPVEKVNGLLRGVYLDSPGPFQIKLVYRPRSIVWGRWISIGTVLILLCGVFIAHYARRQR